LLAHHLQHLLRRDLVRVVADVEQVFFQIDIDATDAWKP